MGEYIDTLGGQQIFSALDAKYSYWRILMDDKDNHTTVVDTCHGLFMNKKMSVDLENVHETSQQAEDVFIELIKWQHIIFYINVEIVLWKSPGREWSTKWK